MNAIRELQQRLRQQFPDAVLELSEPALASGVWLLDVVRNGNFLVVQWRHGGVFALSLGNVEAGIGEKADEVCEDIETAVARVVTLLCYEKSEIQKWCKRIEG